MHKHLVAWRISKSVYTLVSSAPVIVASDQCDLGPCFETVWRVILAGFSGSFWRPIIYCTGTLINCNSLSVNADILPNCRIAKSWPYLLRSSIGPLANLLKGNKRIQHTEHKVRIASWKIYIFLGNTYIKKWTLSEQHSTKAKQCCPFLFFWFSQRNAPPIHPSSGHQNVNNKLERCCCCQWRLHQNFFSSKPRRRLLCLNRLKTNGMSPALESSKFANFHKEHSEMWHSRKSTS